MAIGMCCLALFAAPSKANGAKLGLRVTHFNWHKSYEALYLLNYFVASAIPFCRLARSNLHNQFSSFRYLEYLLNLAIWPMYHDTRDGVSVEITESQMYAVFALPEVARR